MTRWWQLEQARTGAGEKNHQRVVMTRWWLLGRVRTGVGESVEVAKGRLQKQSSDVIHNHLGASGYFLIWIHREIEEHNEDGEK